MYVYNYGTHFGAQDPITGALCPLGCDPRLYPGIFRNFQMIDVPSGTTNERRTH